MSETKGILVKNEWKENMLCQKHGLTSHRRERRLSDKIFSYCLKCIKEAKASVSGN
jgi:hypothetical protein